MKSDNISRQATIDALCNRCDLVNDVPCTEECNDIKILRKLPSTDRKGHWIYVTVEEWLRTGRDYGHHCSECDEINKSGKSNFCPHCGADMREGGRDAKLD